MSRITADGFCNYCNSYILCAGCKREIGEDKMAAPTQAELKAAMKVLGYDVSSGLDIEIIIDYVRRDGKIGVTARFRTKNGKVIPFDGQESVQLNEGDVLTLLCQVPIQVRPA